MTTAARSRAGAMLFWGFILVLAGAVALGVIYLERLIGADARVEALMLEKRQLEAQNQALSARLDQSGESVVQLSVDLEVAAVTQGELERQIALLSEQLRQAREELDYVRSAGN